MIVEVIDSIDTVVSEFYDAEAHIQTALQGGFVYPSLALIERLNSTLHFIVEGAKNNQKPMYKEPILVDDERYEILGTVDDGLPVLLDDFNIELSPEECQKAVEYLPELIERTKEFGKSVEEYLFAIEGAALFGRLYPPNKSAEMPRKGVVAVTNNGSFICDTFEIDHMPKFDDNELYFSDLPIEIDTNGEGVDALKTAFPQAQVILTCSYPHEQLDSKTLFGLARDKYLEDFNQQATTKYSKQ